MRRLVVIAGVARAAAHDPGAADHDPDEGATVSLTKSEALALLNRLASLFGLAAIHPQQSVQEAGALQMVIR